MKKRAVEVGLQQSLQQSLKDMVIQSKAVKLAVVVLIVALVAGLFYYMFQQQQKEAAINALIRQKQNLSNALSIIGNYAQVQKIILSNIVFAKSAIPIEVRLDLEQLIREIKDTTLSVKWKNFTDSANQQETQTAMEDLLEYLANRIAEATQ